jgi:hypothetical protein
MIQSKRIGKKNLKKKILINSFSWKELFKSYYENRWVSDLNTLEISENGKTLVINNKTNYCSCKERNKILICGLKSNEKEKEIFKKEYKWKIKIEKCGYFGVGFAQSDIFYDWRNEISIEKNSFIVCKKKKFIILFL